jgi:hypothetical protein
MNHKGFSNTTIIVAVVAVVIIFGGYFLFQRSQDTNVPTTPTPSAEVFSTQQECEQKTGESCSFQMCDYIPPGKTFEEVCGKDFKKGWVPTSSTQP